MSEFMGKRVNFFLIMMILLLLAGLGGLGVYSQHTVKTKLVENANLTVSLATCQQGLQQTADSLSLAMTSLNSTEGDIKKYDTLYEQKSNELTTKKTELESMKTELNRVTVLKETFKKTADQYYSQIINMNKTMVVLRANVTTLTNRVYTLQDRVDCLKVADTEQEKADCY